MGLLIFVFIVVVVLFLWLYVVREVVKDPMVNKILVVASVVLAILVILAKAGFPVGL